MNIKIFDLGFILTLTGLGVIIISFLLAVMKGKTKVSGGGVILIGPIPIVFTTSKNMEKVLILIVVLIILIMIILTFYLF